MRKLFVLAIAVICVSSFSVFAGGPLKVGDKAPEINLPAPDGKTIALSSLKGKVVLVDFWASWCVPCRKENPNVVKAYKKYKGKNFKNGKGFTVYGVSLDRTKFDWEQAVKDDGLEWPYNVSDLAYWGSVAAKAYGVQSIPTNFLIDGDGTIIGMSLKGAALEQALEGLVKK